MHEEVERGGSTRKTIVFRGVEAWGDGSVG